MTRFFLALAFICAAVPLRAQDIPVQSGDHPTFTRLVLTIGSDRDWTLNQNGPGEWELLLDPVPSGYNIGTVFNLIQRNRLSELVQADGLRLNLACRCPVSASRYNDIYLVVDILDAPEGAAPLPGLDAARAASALPDLADLLAQPRTLPPVAATDPTTDATPTQPAPQPNPAGAPNPRLAEAAEEMAEQLARAAASGLLDAALNQPMTIGDPLQTRAPSPTPDEDAMANAAGRRDPPETSLPVRAETVLDTEITLSQLVPSMEQPGACIGANTQLRSAGGTDRSFSELGPLRQVLFDDRDALDTDAAEAIALHYLSFGFGAEARYWLAEADNVDSTLNHIAAIVDGAQAVAFPEVGAVDNCSRDELLWRYLGGRIPAGMTTEIAARVQLAYGELPAPLRDGLGPRLARQLAQDGAIGTARNIRDALERSGRIGDTQLRLLDLDLGITSESSPRQTEQALEDALQNNRGDAAAVMAQALAFDRTNAGRTNPTRLTAAEALLRESEGSRDWPSLQAEVILANATLGNIDLALDYLADPLFPDPQRTNTITALIENRLAADDLAGLVVLAHLHGRLWRPLGSDAGRVQVRAISTLREAGLFEAAQILSDARPPLILPELPAEPGTPPDPTIQAWQDENWMELAEAGDGLHSNLARRMADLTSGTPELIASDAPPDLDQLSLEIVDSQDLRQTIAALLDNPTPR